MAGGCHIGQQKNIPHTQSHVLGLRGLLGPRSLGEHPGLSRLLGGQTRSAAAGLPAAGRPRRPVCPGRSPFGTENPTRWEACQCRADGDAVAARLAATAGRERRWVPESSVAVFHPESCPCPVPFLPPSPPLRPPAVGAPNRASSLGPAELLVTEAAHVRMLRVLHDLFYQPMAVGGFFPPEELQNIFPSLDELIEVHCECGAAAPRNPTARSLL